MRWNHPLAFAHFNKVARINLERQPIAIRTAQAKHCEEFSLDGKLQFILALDAAAHARPGITQCFELVGIHGVTILVNFNVNSGDPATLAIFYRQPEMHIEQRRYDPPHA